MTSLTSLASGSWWALPDSVKSALIKKIGDKDTWTLDCYKKGVFWAFDLPWLLTYGELLCGGTEKDLDSWFFELTGKCPEEGDTLKLTVSSKASVGYSTKLLLLKEDFSCKDSTYYLDVVTKLECWLCPYLKFLFGAAPDALYVTFDLDKK